MKREKAKENARARFQKSRDKAKEQKLGQSNQQEDPEEEMDVEYERSPEFQLPEGDGDVEKAKKRILWQYRGSDRDDDPDGNQGGSGGVAV